MENALKLQSEKENQKIEIPSTIRICWLRGKEDKTLCPYSFEHSKMLMMNGCPYPFKGTEYSSLLCRGCMEMLKKFGVSPNSPIDEDNLQIIPVSAMPPLMPPVKSTTPVKPDLTVV